MTSGTFVNPKVGAGCDPVDSWYRYYAGYSAGFVEQALQESAATAKLVLDPWNGTGTTTVVAASKNVPAIGFDVNPALVVVSRARLLGAGVWASIDPLSADVVAHVASVELADDPLRFWFTQQAVSSLRGLQQSVHRLLVDSGTASQPAYEGAYLELDDLPMPQTDPEAIVDVVKELLDADITIEDEYGTRGLQPSDIAVGVTHRDQRDHVRTGLQNTRTRTGLPVDEVVVDTANVLQGREFEIVVVWHPLSGRRDASEFHLDAGRLCVLLSRHRQACIVVSRGGIRDQLAGHTPTEPVWLGEMAPALDGWHAHLTVLDHLMRHAV